VRRILLSLAILASGLASTSPLRAGVYDLNPPRSIYRSDFAEAATRNATSVLLRLADLRAIDDRLGKVLQAGPGSLREGYVKQVSDLEASRRAGHLSAEDRLNLGAGLIRLGRLDQARAVLEEAERVVPPDAPGYFLILLNLARAYQEDGELLSRAIVTQSRALKAWPAVWAGWNTAELDWYHRAETFALRLMNLRHAEQRGAGGRAVDYRTVDALFPGVRYIGRDGQYEAGNISFEMRNQLPQDAESLIIQLLLWEPFDDRLFWQYGELLNAKGDIETAYRVMRELVDARNLGKPELSAHRRVLRDAEPTYKKVMEFTQQPAAWVALLNMVAPRGPLMPPVIGVAANEIGWSAAYRLAAEPATAPVAPPPGTALTSSNWLPDWRQITVSFLTGVVVAILGALQWQQWRRPRRAAPEMDAPPAGDVAGPSRYSRPVDG
jgi:tetratricopeptide (TPR) repeat protein